MTHLLPVNDTQTHTLSTECGCAPTLNGTLLVHKAFDNREEQERITGVAAEGKHWKLIEGNES